MSLTHRMLLLASGLVSAATFTGCGKAAAPIAAPRASVALSTAPRSIPPSTASKQALKPSPAVKAASAGVAPASTPTAPRPHVAGYLPPVVIGNFTTGPIPYTSIQSLLNTWGPVLTPSQAAADSFIARNSWDLLATTQVTPGVPMSESPLVPISAGGPFTPAQWSEISAALSANQILWFGVEESHPLPQPLYVETPAQMETESSLMPIGLTPTQEWFSHGAAGELPVGLIWVSGGLQWDAPVPLNYSPLKANPPYPSWWIEVTFTDGTVWDGFLY